MERACHSTCAAPRAPFGPVQHGELLPAHDLETQEVRVAHGDAPTAARAALGVDVGPPLRPARRVCIDGAHRSASAGAVGLGTSLARTTISGETTASTGSNLLAEMGAISVLASHNWNAGNRGARAQATAAGGGLFSGQGAIPIAVADTNVSATLGSGGDVDAGTGAIDVKAELRNRAEADAFALSVGGFAIGGSVATATRAADASVSTNSR